MSEWRGYLGSLGTLTGIWSPRSEATNRRLRSPQSAQRRAPVFESHRASLRVLTWGRGVSVSDSALSASSARSAIPRCERQAISTAERAELWGEGHGADEGAGLVFGRHQATFIGSVVSSSYIAQRLPLSASSAVLRCERQAVSTAERAELWGEGYGADESRGLVFWRHRASFRTSLGVSVSDSDLSLRPLRAPR